jgi:hypothetical protein
MRSPIIKITMLLFGIILSVSAKAQIVTTNPLEYVALAEGNELILGKVKDQMDGRRKRPFAEHHCRRVRADAPVGEEIQQLP